MTNILNLANIYQSIIKYKASVFILNKLFATYLMATVIIRDSAY